MTRLITLVLVVAGLTLVTAPAHADVRLTIHAGRTSFPAGESTTIRGKAWGAKRGSVVKLERKVSGSWRTVAKKRVWSTRRYSFRVSPPRGVQRYRVNKAWHRGQPPAVSRTLRLAVLDLTINAGPTTLLEGESARFWGRAFGANPGSVVKLQRKTGTGWQTVGSRKVWTRRAHTYRFTTVPPRGNQRYRVGKPRGLGQPRVISRWVSVAVTWQPTISVSSTGELDPSGEVWITTVTGTAPELGGVALTVQRYTDGVWSPTGESVWVGGDGQFSHVITGGAAGTRYRYALSASGLRLRSWSEPVTIAAEVYTPTIDITVKPELQTDHGHPVEVYHQVQRLTGTTNAPEAPVVVQAYRDGAWAGIRWVLTGEDGSIDAALPNLPEGTRVRAMVPASSDGIRKRAVSNEVLTTLTPIPLTLDGPQVNIYGVTEGRGAVVEMEATAGDLVTLGFNKVELDGFGLGISWKLYGPDGSEVPEQQYVRSHPSYPEDQDVSRYYRPTTTGTHTLVLSKLDTHFPSHASVRITASTPKVVPVPLDREVTVSTDRPAQPIDLEFTGAADQGISISTRRAEWSCPSAQLFIDDQPVPRRFDLPTEWKMLSVWELPQSGTYRMRLWPCDNTPLEHTIAIVSAEEVQLEYRTDTRIDLGRRGSYGVAHFTTTAGKHIEFERVDWYYVEGTSVVTAPDGTLILAEDFIAPQTGNYKLWIAPGLESYSYITYRATESNH